MILGRARPGFVGSAGPVQDEIHRAEAGHPALEEGDPDRAGHEQPQRVDIVPERHAGGDHHADDGIMEPSLLIHERSSLFRLGV